MEEDGRGRTELLDAAFWRAEGRTERHISPNAHQTLSAACRGPSPSRGLLEATRTRRALGRRLGSDGETAGGAFWWPCCDFGLKTSLFFPPLFCQTTTRMEAASSAPSPPSKPVNHEPISFGIDQILGGGTEPENGRTAGRQSGSDCNSVSDGYYSLGSPAAASAPSYTALSISLSGIMPSVEASGSYVENRSLGSRGVIRVPAHRPMTATGPPAPVQNAVTGFGGLCFPWIGNRFAKDRISGRLLLLKMGYILHIHMV